MKAPSKKKLYSIHSGGLFGQVHVGFIAEFYKCDFWNLWKIWDRYRWTKNILSKTFSSKKMLVERKVDFFFEKNPNFFDILKFSFFIDFFIDFFFSIKIFDFFFSIKKISMEKFSLKFFPVTYSDPKFSKDSKNHT